MTTLAATAGRTRCRLRVAGIVQGVGFRPFVYRLATELDLAGHVGNDAEGVFIEVEGDAVRLEAFEAGLVERAPSLSRIFDVTTTSMAPRGEAGFRIVESHSHGDVRTFVAPDVATCDDCLAELFDPNDRRYRYPFINCTNCGPRFSITVRLPYDRPNTTMRRFALCPSCAVEYRDPRDRRFHAQPVACDACGPSVVFENAMRTVEGTDAVVASAQEALGSGAILAVKGLGGYHLACDANNDEVLARLRQRKGRGDKPFAVMVRDLSAAHELALVSAKEDALLRSPERPIVLLEARRGSLLSALVAPGATTVAVLLPYTPLHHLLFGPVPGSSAPVPSALVMTSGNLSDEPICYEDDDARARLAGLADAWLVHDRPIHVPCDDSVVRVCDGEELAMRRSRGYAPLPVRLSFAAPPLLATGGELKNTFCVVSGRDAWMSQHIGDMGSLATLAAFERSTRQFEQMYEVEPEIVVADRHPGYQTRRWAELQSAPVALVQHHHAHIASVMAEHEIPAGEAVIGFAFDGTGYGEDGAIWGGEVLVADYVGFDRVAHLSYVPLLGGDSAIRKPYRVALSHLRAAGVSWSADLAPVRAAGDSELAAIERQLASGFGCVATSSMGRFFDAVSSLLDIRHVVSYEAQAALELEHIAAAHLDLADPADPVDVDFARKYRFELHGEEIDPAPLLRAMVADERNGAPVGEIAAGFHVAVARLVGALSDCQRRATGIERVALSGGVFQNVLLVSLVRRELARRSFDVLTHRLVPPNDGGLALGQAAIAGCRAAKGAEV